MDSGDICFCAKLMETHQKPMLIISAGKQRQTVGGVGGICGIGGKILTRDDMLNGGANTAEPQTASS